MIKVLITGANGFVGNALSKYLVNAGYSVLGTIRTPGVHVSCPVVTIADISGNTQWKDILDGVDTVIHLAARVHIMEETEKNPQSLFNDVNVNGTYHLAEQAAQAGVKRFIYLSSIKVNGEGDDIEYCADAKPKPEDAYAQSKWQAEQALQQLAQSTALESVIIRPPLIYGPGVKGNFLRLLRFVYNGWPIPLGGVKNQRSIVYVENLCALIEVCITHPNAVNKVLLVSDKQNISTPELIHLLAKALNRPEKLLSIPYNLLKLLAGLTGKQADMQRLCGSLRIDMQKTCDLLNWQPPHDTETGIQSTANWFLNKQKSDN